MAKRWGDAEFAIHYWLRMSRPVRIGSEFRGQELCALFYSPLSGDVVRTVQDDPPGRAEANLVGQRGNQRGDDFPVLVRIGEPIQEPHGTCCFVATVRL